jgi:hypothetical protein
VADPEYRKPTCLEDSAVITDKAIEYKLLPDIHEGTWYIGISSWPMGSHPTGFGSEVTMNIVLMLAESRPIEAFVCFVWHQRFSLSNK